MFYLKPCLLQYVVSFIECALLAAKFSLLFFLVKVVCAFKVLDHIGCKIISMLSNLLQYYCNFIVTDYFAQPDHCIVILNWTFGFMVNMHFDGNYPISFFFLNRNTLSFSLLCCVEFVTEVDLINKCQVWVDSLYDMTNLDFRLVN